MREVRAWRAFVAIAAAAASCAPPPSTPPSPASGRHRVQASGTAADALLARGGTLVADYGSFRILDAPPAALAALEPGAVEMRNEYLRIALSSGDVDTSAPALTAAQRAPAVGEDGKALHLLQFAGPPRPEWYAALVSTRARIVGYVPENAYLVWGDAPALDRVHDLARRKEVQFDAPYAAAQKIDRALAVLDTGAYAVQLVEDPAVNGRTLALVRSMERTPSRVSAALGYVNVVVHADRAAVDALAARPDVVSIQPWVEPRLVDERQDVIVSGQITGGLPNGPGYLGWLAAKGFTQAQFDSSGFGVDVSDSGIDNGTTLPNHFGLYSEGNVAGASRVAYMRLEGTPHAGSTLQGCDGHGNENAHIIAGYSALSGAPFTDASGYRFGLGVAPFVRVGGSVIFDPDSFTSPDFEDLMSRAWASGMRLSSNSWGASTSSYTSNAQRYDALVRDAAPDVSASPQTGNQEMVIVFSAGNSGPSSGTIGSPGNAKNVLSSGASENVQAFGGADGCGVGDTSANAALDVASFSSRGPAADGRTRPDLLAPGTHVSGGVAQAPGQRADPPAVAAGQASSCFVGSGVCGGVGSDFFPSGQQWYTASSGTSHSAPAISGAAALLRQYFLNQGLSAPSPAMTKAYLMSSARYMTGTGAGDSLYSNAQGMGLVDIGTAFDGTPRLLRDQDPADLFTAAGQVRTFTSGVGDPSKPFRATLAWTDAPGATFGAAYNNDLDLTVEIGATVYRGNVFTGATSASGGTADARNNVESVFLPPGTTGTFTVTVTAANVNSDGVPGNGTALDQDFALVVSNVCATPPPAAPTGVTATATAPGVITVSWTPSGAAAYLVYRSFSAGGPYELVSTSAAPPFVDAGRSGGTTYHYVVRAQQGCAVSPASAEASATATGPCLIPPVFAGLASAATTGDEICGVALTWAAATPRCSGTISYDVYRSTTAGFVPSPSNRIATGVAATSTVDGSGISAGTAYHYVVRAVETTPDTSLDDGNTVERAATPMHVTLVLQDDFDANRPADPGALWIERVMQGADRLGLVSGCRWQSPDTSYRFGAAAATCGGTYSDYVENLLVLGGDGTQSPSVNGIAVPAGATMTFRLWYAFESTFDGAQLVYSTAGANGTFLEVPDAPASGVPYIVSGTYDGTLWGESGRWWTGDLVLPNGELRETAVNLDALAGQTAWFGWRAVTDGSVVEEGLYVDDVRIQVGDACTSCSTPTPPPPAGVTAIPTADNVVTISWTANGAASYEVRRAASSGGPYTTIATVAAPPFADGGRSGGTTYYYVVRALQDCAVSAPSAEVSATATGPCLVPPNFAGLASVETTGEVSCGTVLSWAPAAAACGGTLAYDVFRSTDPAFVPGSTNRIAQGVTATGYVDSGTLVSGTEYHYVVRAVETSAGSSVSDGNTAVRSASPTWIVQRFRDDFDANRPGTPAPWWIERATQGTNQLQISSGCRYQSPTNAYRFGASAATCVGLYPASIRNALVLGGDGSTAGVNGVDVPANGGTLAFRLWYSFEAYSDGAWLTYSTSGASGTFTHVPDATSATEPYVSTGGYDQAGPAGVRAWTGYRGGTNGALPSVVVNLDALAGQTAWFAWQFETSAFNGDEGFYLDDVVLEGRAACSTTPPAPGAPVRFRVTGLPATAAADEALSVTATALDAYDQVSTGYSGPAPLTSSDAQAVLPAPVTFASGVASTTVRFRTAGVQSVTVSDVANTSVAGTARTTVLAGSPASLAFTEQPTTRTAGVPFGPAVAVAVRDAFGNAAAATASVAIALAPNPGGGTLAGTTTVTSVGGVATFSGVSIAKAAQGYGLAATSTGLASAASATFDVLPGPAAQLAFVQQPSAAVAGEPIAPAPSVSILDAYGNQTTSGSPVVLALAAGPAGAFLGGTTSVLDTGGVATFDNVWVSKAGTGYVLLATCGFVPSASSDPFAAVAGPPSHVVFAQEPGAVRAGEPFSPPIAAVLLDRFDNPSTTATNQVSLSFASNPTSATLLGTTSVGAVAGIASFPGVAVDRAGTPFALYVGASGIMGDTSVGFEVLPALAAAYAVAGPGTAEPGAPASYTVTAVDDLGNVVPYYTGTATVTASDPAAELPGTVTFAEGLASISVTFRTPGQQTLAFTESGGSTTGSISVEVHDPDSGGCGCGTGSAGTGAALLALLLARPRRRARS